MKKFVTFAFALVIGLFVLSPIGLFAATDAPTDGAAGPSKPVEPLEHYEPLPVKHSERDVNQTVLGSGLGFAGLLIGGAMTLDKRKK